MARRAARKLGPAIELKPGYETFWAYIPHFIHSPFYVYAYAFGDCLVNSLYAVYEHAADGFAERYLAMLSAGGTKHHSELLAPFGLDARDPILAGRAWRHRADDRRAGKLVMRMAWASKTLVELNSFLCYTNCNTERGGHEV